ncbi:YIP1 family protein [Cohnella fermenti]|uniref:YIP1 family protein n=1 Tax=Cohnella fermenti TaxID=2565925 RepID=A0A4S4BNI8_9BACL|nr:YIP1 family protein [Cohnella fermenti]THF74076.1 YIP1 family protein [Cohnella fermenti]
MSRELFKYPFYLISHPFNGFWELKYELNRKASLVSAFVILFLLAITTVLQNQYSGFLVNFVNPNSLNSFMEIVYVLLPVLFWCIANWSLTTLMDGEGKFVEIFISTCFAFFPVVLIQFPWIWLSNLISLQETSFYYFFINLSTIWCVFLLFIGNMTVHQYTPSKTILTMVLSVVAIGFMAFLCLLFFSLVQQIIAFISTIYQEFVLRS